MAKEVTGIIKLQIPAGQAEGPVPVVKKLASATRMN